MKSHWTIAIKTSEVGIFIKKIERFLSVKLVDPKYRNDYQLGSDIYTVIDCFIDHSSNDFSVLVFEMFNLIKKISVQWDLSLLDIQSDISGTIDSKVREEIGGYDIHGPSGIRSISWRILKDQDYQRLW